MKRLGVALLAAAALAGAGTARADVYDDRPAAASRGPGDMVVVARGADGAVYERHLAGGAWTPWTSIGGQVSSGPAAAAYGDTIQIFALGQDGSLFQNVLRGGAWSGWTPLGGVGTSAPSAINRRGTPILDVAMRGTDNAIHMRSFQPGSGWSGWGSLGGNLTSSPALNSQDPGILNVFARGTDGTLVQKSYTSSGWTEWLGLAGGLVGGPTVVSRMENQLDLFVRGTDNGLHQRYWTGAASWSEWGRVDPAPLDSAPAAVSDTGSHLAIFARRGGSIAVKEWYASSGWTGWSDFGVPAPPPPAPGPPARDGNVQLTTGLRCTPPGGRLRVSLRIRRRAGTARPRVRRVVFFVKRGPRSVDRRRPFVRRLRLNRPAGSKGRVYARAFYTRKGSQRLHRKTVSKRYVMCG